MRQCERVTDFKDVLWHEAAVSLSITSSKIWARLKRKWAEIMPLSSIHTSQARPLTLHFDLKVKWRKSVSLRQADLFAASITAFHWQQCLEFGEWYLDILSTCSHTGRMSSVICWSTENPEVQVKSVPGISKQLNFVYCYSLMLGSQTKPVTVADILPSRHKHVRVVIVSMLKLAPSWNHSFTFIKPHRGCGNS